MAKTFYHYHGCESATVAFKGKTVLYSGTHSLSPIDYCHISRQRIPSQLTSLTSQPKTLIVAGYVLGEMVKTVPEVEIPITEVEPLTDATERKELSDILAGIHPQIKDKGEYAISFW